MAIGRKSKEKSEPFVFSDTVLKGGDVKLTELMEIDSRMDSMQITIPPGPEGDLRIKVYFLTSKGTPRNLVKFVGSKNYFDGDDIVYNIPLDVPVEAYSTLVVEGENLTDEITGFDYSLNVILNVSYEVGE